MFESEEKEAVIPKMSLRSLRRSLALLALVCCAPAQASIIFTPHLSEYGVLPRGSYADHTLIYTSIDKVYDANGNETHLGAPFVPPGESVDATLLLFRYLWIGNLFENTDIPFLKNHNQIFRVIGNVGWQTATGAVAERSRLFSLHSNGTGFGDVFFLAGLYGSEYRMGPVKWNPLFAVTYKAPIGDYDTESLLNTGTNYETTIPQIAFHAEAFGRVYFDGTVARQFNGTNSTPAYGGLTPNRPADVDNIELNFAWKFSEKWFVDFGWFHRKSRGPNKFDKVTVNFKDPLPASSGCANLGIPPNQCTLTNGFRLKPFDRPREDRGIKTTYLSSSLYYIYRTSSVIDFRVVWPISGRGSQFAMEYDVLAQDGTQISQCQNPASTTCVRTTLNGVQEAAAVPAVPLYELRFVYLFWAP